MAQDVERPRLTWSIINVIMMESGLSQEKVGTKKLCTHSLMTLLILFYVVVLGGDGRPWIFFVIDSRLHAK